MELDLVCVESFLVLLSEGHYGRAGARLHVSTSALTKRIQRLERQVGVPLVDRGPVLVTATEAGERFAERAAPLLGLARAAQRAARDPGRRIFRLGIPGGVGEYPRRADLLRLGARLRRSHRTVSLQCVGVPYDDLRTDLDRGRVDAVWAAGSLEDPETVSVPFAPLVRVGLVGPDSRFADATSVPLAEFLDQPLLVNPEVPAAFMDLWWFGDVQTEREAHLLRISARSMAQVHAALVTHRAATVSHRPMLVDVPRGVRVVELSGGPPQSYTLSRRRRDHGGPFEDLLEGVREVFGTPGHLAPVDVTRHGSTPRSR